jgi:transcriptional regulator with XRE-family HTH domain
MALTPDPHPLRQWRLANGVTIQQFAEMAGTHFTTIGRIERRQKRDSTLRLLARITKITGLSADVFLPADDDVR